MKRGTEDLDFFIGDEALAAAAGPGMFDPEVERCQEHTHISQAMEFITPSDTGKSKIG
jgi:hypothetical protein